MGGFSSAAEQAEWEQNREELRRASTKNADIERHATSSEEDLKNDSPGVGISGKGVLVHSVNKPLFHLDLTAALQSAVYNAEHRKQTVPQELVRQASVSQ
jgi:sodium-independent sulfate anion transporter 11